MKTITGFLAALSLLGCSCSHKQTSTPAERLTWHTEKLTKAYETMGRHDPKWDASARNAVEKFARIRAGTDDADTGVGVVGSYAEEAVNAGCDDPLVLYLYCRFAPDYSSRPLKYWQDEYRKAAHGMEASGYAPVLKFYANDRAANVLWQERDHALWPEITQFRRAAMNDLSVALQDKSMPPEEVEDSCDALLDTIGANDQEVKDAYAQMESTLFNNWPHSSAPYYVKARFYYRFAWQARGGGYADKVTEEGWKGFRDKLATADAAFKKAWSLNPSDVRVPTQMIEMAVSEQMNRDEMEQWFERAMQLNTNNYDACANKLRYLRPEWYGSRDDMLAFGRECVASSKWGGRVPLILVDAHYQWEQRLEQKDQDGYWRQSDVWPDIQSSYEKFFQLNPEPKGNYRYYYAWYAYRCGQWQDFKAQIKVIRDSDGTVDTAFFGGDEAFNKMVEQANSGEAKN